MAAHKDRDGGFRSRRGKKVLPPAPTVAPLGSELEIGGGPGDCIMKTTALRKRMPSLSWRTPMTSLSLPGGRVFGTSTLNMSPTILRKDGYRFYFFSREEGRPHVHVQRADGHAKFWLEPAIEVAQSSGLSRRELRSILTLVEEHANEIRTAWAK